MTLFRFRFRDGLRRFCDQVSPEVPLGTSGPTQAPSTYVADRGVCILECMCYSFSPNKPLTRFFCYAFWRDKRDGRVFALERFFLSFLLVRGSACLSSSLLGSLIPQTSMERPKTDFFFLVNMVTSLIQPRPSMTDALGGQYFSLAATDRSLSSRRGM